MCFGIKSREKEGRVQSITKAYVHFLDFIYPIYWEKAKMHFLVELMQDDGKFIKHISVSSRGNRILYSFTYFLEYR